MDAIRSWATTACLAALIAGIAGIVAPSGKLEKVYKFAVSLFFLSCLLVPLFNLKNIALSSVNFPQTQTSVPPTSLQSAVDTQTEIIAQGNVETLVKSYCKGVGVTPSSVDVTVQNTGGKLSVQSVTIVLKKADMWRKDKIADEVKEKLGIGVEIKEGEK